MYQKVNAVEEIQQTNKDDFWNQTQVSPHVHYECLRIYNLSIIWSNVTFCSSEGWRSASTAGEPASTAGQTNSGEGEEGDGREAGEGEGEEREGESSADRTGQVSQTQQTLTYNQRSEPLIPVCVSGFIRSREKKRQERGRAGSWRRSTPKTERGGRWRELSRSSRTSESNTANTNTYCITKESDPLTGASSVSVCV